MCLLGLLLIASSCASAKRKKNTGKKPVEYALTVAAIRDPQPAEQYVEVSFNESARFYKLPKNADPKYRELLEQSQKTNTAVLVKRANEYSDIILRVRRK
jgi:hypothetical protein